MILRPVFLWGSSLQNQHAGWRERWCQLWAQQLPGCIDLWSLLVLELKVPDVAVAGTPPKALAAALLHQCFERTLVPCICTLLRIFWATTITKNTRA